MKFSVLLFLLFSYAALCQQPEQKPLFMKGNQNEKLKYLALGDSYTIGESVNKNQTFPFYISNELEKDSIYIESNITAVTGWTTKELLEAIKNTSSDYDLVSLLIGVNNQYQKKSIEEYKIEFEQLLLKAIELARGDKAKVFVLSIPDYGFSPFGVENQKEISKQIDNFNSVNLGITKKLGVRYFNITPISRMGLENSELIAEDGLHPSGKQYKMWAALILPDLKKNIVR